MGTIAVITAGDPGNAGFDYASRAQELAGELKRLRYDVVVVPSAQAGIDAIFATEEKRGKLLFVSAYFCEEARRLAKEHWPHIHVVVSSVGMPPVGMPVFLFRGMMTPTVIPTVFGVPQQREGDWK